MAEDFGQTVANSITATLDREARRNEQTIASVRVATMVCLLGIEAWLLLEGSVLGSWMVPLASMSFVYTLIAVGLWWTLARGVWIPAFQWAAPAGDTLFFTVRQGVSLYVVGAEGFMADQDLSTVMGFCCLLILSSAFRLSGALVLFSAALAFSVYIGFASAIRLERFFVTLQLIFLLGTTMASYALTFQVLRAVQGEVRRLTIGRLLPASVLEQVDSDPVALLSQPRSLNATVVVTDIRGFTTWAEHRAPMDVLDFLNRVQGGLADIVQLHQGTVDKFMGDGMLAVFGAPVASEDHADRALRAVEAMHSFIETFDAVQLGVGVHTGQLVVGCLGSGVRMEFTILGDTVNTASRLEAKTKELGVAVLISDATATASSIPVKFLEEISIRGRDQLMRVHTLLPQSR